MCQKMIKIPNIYILLYYLITSILIWHSGFSYMNFALEYCEKTTSNQPGHSVEYSVIYDVNFCESYKSQISSILIGRFRFVDFVNCVGLFVYWIYVFLLYSSQMERSWRGDVMDLSIQGMSHSY